MSCSRAGLSNPALYAFQPHTPYLLLTASNWNCDHIFHTVPQLHSLLKSTSLLTLKWVSQLSLLISLSVFFPPSLCSPPAFRDSSTADPDMVSVCLRVSLCGLGSPFVKIEEKKRQEWTWDWIRRTEEGKMWINQVSFSRWQLQTVLLLPSDKMGAKAPAWRVNMGCLSELNVDLSEDCLRGESHSKF